MKTRQVNEALESTLADHISLRLDPDTQLRVFETLLDGMSKKDFRNMDLDAKHTLIDGAMVILKDWESIADDDEDYADFREVNRLLRRLMH